MSGAEVFALLAMGAVLLIGFLIAMNQEKKLLDPENIEVVYLPQLTEVCELGGGREYRLRVFRQSGNPQQDDKKFQSLDEAIKSATSTFKRAKIDYVVITDNREDCFSFRRPYHSHRGVKEGKKVGSAEIVRVGVASTTADEIPKKRVTAEEKKDTEVEENYTVRSGELVPTDSVFEAWTARDLEKMLAELDTKTHAIDRHFLLMTIVDEAYKQRKEDSKMRELCAEVSEIHLKEFPELRPALQQSTGGVLPRVPTFQKYATLLTEEQNYDRAIEVCESAIAHGLHDGTKSGFDGRIARIKKKAGK